MKKILIALSIILSIGLLNNTANAQVSISVNVNSQPAWGPTGYDYAGFYYFPDLNIYFDINNSLFYYRSGSNWISNRYLPDKYSKYDFYNMYKIVMNDNNQPWLNNNMHKKEYSNYKNNKTQVAIRNSNDNKYSQSKNNTTVWVNNNNNQSKNNNGNNQSSNNNKNQSKDNNTQSKNNSKNNNSKNNKSK